MPVAGVLSALHSGFTAAADACSAPNAASTIGTGPGRARGLGICCHSLRQSHLHKVDRC